MTDVMNRWKGLRSYDERDSSFFCGREEEAEQLYRMVMRETLTTIFAPSGTGKTSLLQAGLFPKLREHGYFPIRIRLNHNAEGPDLSRYVRDAIEAEAKRIGLDSDSCVPPLVGPEEETLWEYMHRIEFWDQDENIVTPIIVFDQFEEVFTLGRARPESEHFLQELADLIEKRMPQRVRARLNESGDRRRIPLDFQGFKIVLALRQDFVAQLDDLRRSMPSVMHNRYPLHEFTSDQALQAVMGPGDGIISEPVARQIVRVLGKTKSDTDLTGPAAWDNLRIEPSLLSLVCSELDKQRRKNGDAQIVADQLETQRDHIIRDFYESSFEGLDPKARVFIEDKLLTATGYRKTQPLDDALEEGLTPEARRRLVDRHVIRQVDHRDITHIELTHDLLCSIVKESRDRRREKQETEELRRVRRGQRRKVQFFATTTVILVALSLVTVKMMWDAKESEQRAELETIRADASAQRANELMDFMTDDLYDRLMPIGRLDLLESVALRAQSHYDQLAPEDATPENTVARAGVLSKIADVLARRGNISEAFETHERAIEYLSSDEYEGALELQRQRVLADALLEYAQVHNRWGSATESLDLLDQAESLVQNEPGVQREVALWNERHQLTRAHAMLRLGQTAQAEALLSPLLVLSDETSAGKNNPRLSLEADAHRAQATLHLQRGEIADAIRSQRKSLLILHELLGNAPSNEEWMAKKVEVLRGLAQMHVRIGDYDGGIDKLEAAIAIAKTQVTRIGDATDLLGKQWLLTDMVLAADLAELRLNRLESFYADALDEDKTRLRIDAYLVDANKGLDSLSKQADTRLSDQFLMVKARVCVLQSRQLEQREAFTDAKAKLDAGLQQLDQLGEAFSQEAYATVVRAAMTLRRGLLEEQATYQPTVPRAYAEALGLLLELDREPQASATILRQLVEIHEAEAEAAQLRGQTRAASRSYEQALDLRKQATEVDPENQASQREYAYALIAFADFQPKKDQAGAINPVAAEHYRQGAELLESLTASSEVVRLSDRLALLRASDLAEGKTHEAIAAKTMYFPCVFVDKLAGDSEKQVDRRVFSPLTILIDSSILDSGDKGPLEIEVDRLRHDLLLKLESNLKEELDKRYRLIREGQSDTLALAQFTDLEMNSKSWQRSGYIERGLVLHSPVQNQYPKRAPTVVGTECWLTWDFAGTAESIRNFQLQVATNPSFTGTLVYNKVIPGTRERLDFSPGTELADALNQKLYWRVRPVPGDVKESDDTPAIRNDENWSLTQAVEIYASLWDRIKAEGKIRIGISEFEGDLIELEDDSTTPSGFDGAVLHEIQSKLTAAYNAEVPGKLKEGELLELEIFKYGWDGMFEAVGRNEVELAISIITRTKEREARFGIKFSEPYYETQLSAVFVEDRVDIKSLQDIKGKKLIVNRGFRGHDIGRLIIGGEPDAKSFANLPNLLRSLKGEERDVALTDHAFIMQLIHQKDPSVRGIETYELTAEDFASLLKQAIANEAEPAVIEQLKDMFSDYGGAEWEQYAVATSAVDDGKVLQLINEAILSIRQTNTLVTYCRKSGLPIPGRLVGENQLYEGTRRLATVLPLAIQTPGKTDSDTSATKLAGATNGQVVMSDRLEFHWQPLDQYDSGYYAIQIASDPLFQPHQIVYKNTIQQTAIAVDPTKDLPRSGEYFWRAKRVFSVDEDQQDQFPADGWCSPIRFQYWSNCIDRIVENKELLVAVNVANGYSVYRDPKSHAPVGFDVDIANAIAAKLAEKYGIKKIKVTPVRMQFNDMFVSVRDYQTDLAMSGITATEEREKDKGIIFSEPYCRTQQALIYIDKPGAGTPQWLKTAKIIGFEGTRAQKMAAHLVHPDQMVTPDYQPKPYLLEQILAGQAQAAITDYPAAIKLVEDFESHNTETTFTIKAIGPETFPPFDPDAKPKAVGFFYDRYGIPTAPDQQVLRDLINETIRSLQSKENGQAPLNAIFDEHITYDKTRFTQPFEITWTQSED